MFDRESTDGRILLVVYVDGDNRQEISNLKSFLMQKFETKDLGRPKHFLVIEVAHSSKCIFLSQREYVIDLLEETCLLGSMSVHTSMYTSRKLTTGEIKALGTTRIIYTCNKLSMSDIHARA